MDNLSFEQRVNECNRLINKYPNRIPVIVTKSKDSKIPDIDKNKFLVPSDQTIGQMVYVIRNRIKLSQEKALFIFVNNILPPTGEILAEVYKNHKDTDGFLYITYACENVFGTTNTRL
tara:strand:+ start:1458 stop:1811 length:354 start_codon:yes stop_codon:yes gene_type:complete